MAMSRARRSLPLLGFILLALAPVTPAIAAPEGTLTWAVHVTIAARWVDPGETEAVITPFMVYYALHDALVKPMPGQAMAPSLAESWSVSKDGLTYDFLLRKTARFHNGDPVTAEDVKFSYERYKGTGAAAFKERVRQVQVVDPVHVRFVLKEPWPDFMTFYGTTATGAGWIVPKKYVEKVGDDGFKKAPVGAGPYKVVSFTPGVELILEAFEGYWRKVPSVKRLVLRTMPEETTRAAALKKGEADIAYLLSGPVADDVRKTPGLRLVAPLLNGVFWLDFPDQWTDPKSPWADKRVRQAASFAVDRAAVNDAELLGLGKLVGNFIPPTFEFALTVPPDAYDPARAKKLLAEAGYPNGLDAGDFYPYPPYSSMGEAVAGYLGAVGIRTRVRTLERAAYLAAYRDRKLHGVLVNIVGSNGNAATRIETFLTKGGMNALGSPPEVDDLFHKQARELDRKKREAILHQIQRIVADRTLYAPLYQLAFIWGVGPRVQEPGADLLKGHAYSAPYEDVKIKK